MYLYDFTKGWTFLVELININKDASSKTEYPSVSRKEGIGPQQYGTKSLLGDKFADIEEKYDLTETAEGFSKEGGDSEDGESAEESFEEENTQEEI